MMVSFMGIVVKKFSFNVLDLPRGSKGHIGEFIAQYLFERNIGEITKDFRLINMTSGDGFYLQVGCVNYEFRMFQHYKSDQTERAQTLLAQIIKERYRTIVERLGTNPFSVEDFKFLEERVVAHGKRVVTGDGEIFNVPYDDGTPNRRGPPAFDYCGVEVKTGQKVLVDVKNRMARQAARGRTRIYIFTE